MKETVIAYLIDHPEAKAAAIAEYVALKPSRTRDYLNEPITEEIVVAEGGNRNRTYRLKSWLSVSNNPDILAFRHRKGRMYARNPSEGLYIQFPAG